MKNFLTELWAVIQNIGIILRSLCGESTTQSPQNPATPTTPNPPADYSPDELALLDLHNELRRKSGLAALKLDSKLTAAARKHAAWMAANNRLTHYQPTSTVKDRINSEGYQGSNLAENIASGYSTLDGAVNAWFQSLGHRKNILGNYSDVGFGIADGKKKYYCACFGKPGEKLITIFYSGGVEKK